MLHDNKRSHRSIRQHHYAIPSPRNIEEREREREREKVRVRQRKRERVINKEKRETYKKKLGSV